MGERVRLTPAMLEALTGPVRHPGYGITLLCYGTRQTLEALERRGLVNGAALTEAGMFLRTTTNKEAGDRGSEQKEQGRGK